MIFGGVGWGQEGQMRVGVMGEGGAMEGKEGWQAAGEPDIEGGGGRRRDSNEPDNAGAVVQGGPDGRGGYGRVQEGQMVVAWGGGGSKKMAGGRSSRWGRGAARGQIMG